MGTEEVARLAACRRRVQPPLGLGLRIAVKESCLEHVAPQQSPILEGAIGAQNLVEPASRYGRPSSKYCAR